MKKNILLLTCAVLVTLSQAFAGDVTLQDAQTVAVNFFKIKLGSNAPRNLAANLQYTRTESDNSVDFYVFNIEPAKGFVIISATDNDMPVIGYSTESTFRNDFSKIGLNEWLNRWSTEIHYVKTNNIIATPKAAMHWAAYRQGIAPAIEKASPVAPFCPTTWDQQTEYSSGPNLYNNFCPGGTGTNQSVTGCVATTMAQIMRYWKYPARGIGSSSYNDSQSQGYTSNYGVLSANYADSVFDWGNMPAALSYNSSAVQINAVGRLMSCAGISVAMDYSPTGSGAAVLIDESGGGPNAQNSYVQYFGYQNVIEGIGLSGTNSGANNQVGTAAFIDSIEAELNAARLVQIEGNDATQGGHTWVCDGYDANNNLHMNWGWGGYADGYFAVTSMNPNDGSQLNFSQDIGILTHILPPAQNNILHEQAAATLTGICPGAPTQLSATTHTNTTYSWTPTTGLSNSTISNPVATPTTTTTYVVTADSAGVTAQGTVTITVHGAPTAAINSAANPTCNGAGNGSATVSVSGGTSGYTYHWTNGSTTAALTNLGPGTYAVTVTDANSCTGTATKTLTQPNVLTATTGSITAATCGQPNGSATVTATGGTTIYHYAWSNGATTATASNLAGNTYNVTVTDAHSCSTTASAVVTSSGSLNLSTSATNELCFGSSTGSATATVTGSTGNVTYHWSNGATTASIQNVAASSYSVTISDGSGCTITASKSVSQPAALSATVQTTAAGCGNVANGGASLAVTGGTMGYSFHWSNSGTASSISGVAAGTYNVTITDANNCSTTMAAVVATATPVSIVATSNNATCFGENNGSAQVNVTSGTQPYTYSWSTGATTATVSSLTAGSYSVTIHDANSCTASTNVAVTQPNQIQITTTAVNATGVLDNGSATVANVVGAAAPYTYYWSNGGTSQTISNIGPGNYTVTVTDHNGCMQTAADFVNVSTGVNTITSTLAFTVYPNPAGSYVLVQLDEFNSSTVMNLKNILGQTVISQTISAKQTQLDLGTLSNGVYLVELRQGEKTAVKQLVIAR